MPRERPAPSATRVRRPADRRDRREAGAGLPCPRAPHRSSGRRSRRTTSSAELPNLFEAAPRRSPFSASSQLPGDDRKKLIETAGEPICCLGAGNRQHETHVAGVPVALECEAARNFVDLRDHADDAAEYRRLQVACGLETRGEASTGRARHVFVARIDVAHSAAHVSSSGSSVVTSSASIENVEMMSDSYATRPSHPHPPNTSR